MKKFLLLTLLLIPTSLFANPILYTFSTTSGVTGSFTLDDSAPFVIKTQGFYGHGAFPATPFTYYYAAAPFISGTYGAYSLLGVGDCCIFEAGLHINDYRPPYDSAVDQLQGDDWMLRAAVSSNVLNGRSAIGFSIFDTVSPDSFDGPSYSPPIPGHLMGQNIRVIVSFSDGTFDERPLASLTLVPEMPSLALLPLGLLGILIVYLPKRGKA